jgi:hypothetical protein
MASRRRFHGPCLARKPGTSLIASSIAREQRSSRFAASNTQLAARQDRDLAASNKLGGNDGPELTASAASGPRLVLGVQVCAVATGRPRGPWAEPSAARLAGSRGLGGSSARTGRRKNVWIGARLSRTAALHTARRVVQGRRPPAYQPFSLGGSAWPSVIGSIACRGLPHPCW